MHAFPSTDNRVKVSFIVPALNEERHIVDCLRALQSQEVDFAHELIVVDNGSRDATANLAQLAGARVVSEPLAGLARARQAGFLAATGEILVFVDADTRIDGAWTREIVRRFDDQPRLAAVSSAFDFHDGRTIDNLGNTLFRSALMPLVGALLRHTGRPDVVLGAAFAVRAAAVRAVGGIDQSFQFYGEDTLIATRLHRAGDVRFLARPRFSTSARRYQQHGLARVVWRYFSIFALLQLGRTEQARHLAIRYRNDDHAADGRTRRAAPLGTSRCTEVAEAWEPLVPAALYEDRIAAGEP